MRALVKAVCRSLVLVAVLQSGYYAQARNHQELQETCRNEVQAFYNWYVKNSPQDDAGPAWELALQNKNYEFDLELVRAFRALHDQAQTGGNTALDLDPFLNSRDPGERYAVQGVTAKDGACWAQVYGIWPGAVRKSDKPDVVAELAQKKGGWIFVNFHYPTSQDAVNENLLSILRSRSDETQGTYPRK
jgi:hypothetical protein